MGHAIDSLGFAHAVGVVSVADTGAGLGSGGQLPAVLPGEGPPGAVVIAGGVTHLVVDDFLLVIILEQVTPTACVIGVSVGGRTVGCRHQVAAAVVGVGIDFDSRGFNKLFLGVLGVGGQVRVIGQRCCEWSLG